MQDESFRKTRHARILVIDDEIDICRVLAMCLEAQGHDVTAVHTAAEGLAEAQRRGAFDIAFLDLRLGTAHGIEFIAPLLASSPWLRVIVITAYAAVDTAVEAMKRGATDYLPKPFMPTQVKLVVKKVIEAQALEWQAAALQEAMAGVIPAIDLADTASAEMRDAAELARRSADGSATILIQGESGVGKRTVARAIHGWSPRVGRPMAIAGCRAPSVALLETEWFGAGRKMPGGAVAAHPGRVAWCDGGTLIIEDVDQLPASTQSRVLRLIQDREYERPGDFAVLKADVRVIATTSADLNALVAAGAFRADLLFALRAVQIDLPPLRRRTEDIEGLTTRYLAFFARQTRRTVTGFTPAAIDALRGHSWPGNVRELRNLVERAVLVSRGERIDVRDFPPGILNRVNAVALGDPVSLERVEELHIRGVLQSSPSIEAAAETLGMDSVTLWRRRKKYGI